MKIALAANRPNMDGEIDPRFGRCRYFIFIEPDTLRYEVEENPNQGAASGAGISTAQFVVNRGAQVLITGNIGPNGYRVLSESGIQVFTGVSGGLRDVMQAYQSGDLKSSSGPTGGMGMGRGAGQGGGMGRAKLGGLGINQGEASWRAGDKFRKILQKSDSSRDEIALLKVQAEVLANELVKIQQRIQEMENQ
ncbi:NifB/NifX family molybdenum-iron cluster-binding protein [Desulfoferrobacter suflitae]|uniref:NifB/NifX family molybdenum-iron cluster-binding protein n=1 Tax=Desulfoferrobacter suflitae TaxID=2865782 RepID=UPI002164E4CE|nr:NifB/NifX family molybdenum-iron cluster-binding protein [Desulfoferrobacter suflitae]MCK8603585.1 NifB/NifX family molybdenum-iron cluster-binding protein [Desulfoferrobacter suflitae]